MELFEKDNRELIRIQFGYHTSITFTDTTVINLFDIAIKVFSAIKIDKTLVVKGSPLTSPKAELSIILSVREEGSVHGKHQKGKAKSKTMFGLSGEEAKQIFLTHYKNYI